MRILVSQESPRTPQRTQTGAEKRNNEALTALNAICQAQHAVCEGSLYAAHGTTGKAAIAICS